MNQRQAGGMGDELTNAALVGLIVGPAYNFVVHGPFHV